MSATLPDEAGDPTDQAARWLSYLYSGSTSEEGLQAFATWLRRSPANGDAYGELQQMWCDLASVEGHWTAASPSRYPQRRFAQRMAVAAVLLISLLGGAIWQIYQHDPVAVADYRTGIAEIRRVRLTDGSVVTLSALTSFHAEVSRAKRSVVLGTGQAFFAVAPDRSRPFVVDAGRARVAVVGTEFDVSRSSDEVRVSVAKGVVEVGPSAGDASRGIRLIAGQRVTTSRSGKPGAVESFDASRVMPWLRGMLVYRDEPLSHVVADVNRYRVLKISLADDTLARMPITMALRTDETDSLLTGLEAMRVATIEKTARGVVIHPWEPKRSP